MKAFIIVQEKLMHWERAMHHRNQSPGKTFRELRDGLGKRDDDLVGT